MCCIVEHTHPHLSLSGGAALEAALAVAGCPALRIAVALALLPLDTAACCRVRPSSGPPSLCPRCSLFREATLCFRPSPLVEMVMAAACCQACPSLGTPLTPQNSLRKSKHSTSRCSVCRRGLQRSLTRGWHCSASKRPLLHARSSYHSAMPSTDPNRSLAAGI